METIESNNLFFTASLIELIARRTNNTKSYVVEKLGKETINKIYTLAEVYHSENIDKIVYDFINEFDIQKGDYILNIKDGSPSYWDIGRVYQRLVNKIDSNPNNYVDTLYEVLTSWIIKYIDNYDSSLYYENPDYIYECYKENKII